MICDKCGRRVMYCTACSCGNDLQEQSIRELNDSQKSSNKSTAQNNKNKSKTKINDGNQSPKIKK